MSSAAAADSGVARSPDDVVMTWQSVVGDLLAGRDLSEEQSGWAMNETMLGRATPVMLTAFLVALRAKGVNVAEMRALSDTMLAHAQPFPAAPQVKAHHQNPARPRAFAFSRMGQRVCKRRCNVSVTVFNANCINIATRKVYEPVKLIENAPTFCQDGADIVFDRRIKLACSFVKYQLRIPQNGIYRCAKIVPEGCVVNMLACFLPFGRQ